MNYFFNKGERFDFVLHANKKKGDYFLIKTQGLLDCMTGQAYQTAILSYKSVFNHENFEWKSLEYNSTIRDGKVSSE